MLFWLYGKHWHTLKTHGSLRFRGAPLWRGWLRLPQPYPSLKLSLREWRKMFSYTYIFCRNTDPHWVLESFRRFCPPLFIFNSGYLINCTIKWIFGHRKKNLSGRHFTLILPRFLYPIWIGSYELVSQTCSIQHGTSFKTLSWMHLAPSSAVKPPIILVFWRGQSKNNITCMTEAMFSLLLYLSARGNICW